MLTALLFGCITTLSAIAYESGTTAQSLVLVRCLLFAIVVGALLRPLGRPLTLSRDGWQDSLRIAAPTAVMSLGYMASVAYIPVTLAAIIFFAFPLLVALFAAASGWERLSGWKALALLVAFGGLALALAPRLDALDWRGIVCAVLSGAAMAVVIAFSGPTVRRHDPLTFNVYVNLWMLAAVAAVFIPVGGLAWPTTAAGLAASAGVCLLYLSGFIAWFLALRLISPVRVASLFNLEPMVTIAVAYVVLGERLNTLQSLGVGLTLGAILSMTLFGRKPAA